MTDTLSKVVGVKGFDLVGALMGWEAGELGREEEIELFQHLVDTGLAWSLQGAYGRQAQRMIDAGWIEPKESPLPVPGMHKGPVGRGTAMQSDEDGID